MLSSGLDSVKKFIFCPFFVPNMVNPRLKPSVKEPADLRQRILDASEQLLESEGLGALSMREVARRSGVTHQAPYHHFADRESILAELVARGFGELTRRLAKANARDSDFDPLLSVVESGKAYVGFAIDHPGVFRIMFRSEICDPARFPAALQAGGNAYRELERMVVRIHGEAQMVRLAGVYWAQVHGLASLIVDGPIGHQLASVRKRRTYMHEALTRFAQRMLACPTVD